MDTNITILDMNGSLILDPNNGYRMNVEGLPSRAATALGAAIMLVFFLEGFLGNLWILTAILSNRRMWNVINVFIVSLCINDLLSLCLVVLLIIDSYVWHRWTAGTIMCRLNPEFTVAFTGCSLWHTALIAIHRYIVVCHNMAYKRMSKEAYVVAVLLLTRAIPTACTIPGFALTSSGYVPKLLRCILLPSQKGRIIAVTLVQILAPCLIVVICYALIFGFVIRMSRQVHDSNLILQREIQITKMFGLIFLMILVGFVPYAAVRNADRGNTYSGDVYVIVTVFYGIATCSNPVVYGAMSTDVRSTCWQTLQIVCRLLRCERVFPCMFPAQPDGTTGGTRDDASLEMPETTVTNITKAEPLQPRRSLPGGGGVSSSLGPPPQPKAKPPQYTEKSALVKTAPAKDNLSNLASSGVENGSASRPVAV